MQHATVPSPHHDFPYSTKHIRLGRIVLDTHKPGEKYYDLFPDPEQLNDTGKMHISPDIDLERINYSVNIC